MAAAQPKPELLVIAGTTASGKTELALKIAKRYRGEIISADSWTVYKGFNIGTAKSTITQQKAVKHHLIDVRQATDGFNAPMFKELAEAAIADIRQRGKLPILAGGTGLYIDSVLYDYGFLPNLAAAERAALDAMSLPELIGKAKEEDIDLAGVDIRNKRRVVRAIEAKGQKPTRRPLRQNTLVIGLWPEPDQLKPRVEARVDAMLAAGLEKEVKDLAAKYGWEVEPLKGIGYREWREYFEGGQSLEQTRSRIISATNNLAKRQRTWFKRSPDIVWFSSVNQAYDYLTEKL